MGHKRLALEAGEDPVHNTMEYYLDSINTIYSIKHKNGAIRRVNINIAATTVDNYRLLKEAEVGTYILFQETYHKESYLELHPTGPKHDYDYHTEAMDRTRSVCQGFAMPTILTRALSQMGSTMIRSPRS